MSAKCVKLTILLATIGYSFIQCPIGTAQKVPRSESSRGQKEFQENGSQYFSAGTFRMADGSPDDHYGDSLAWYLRSIDEPPLPNDTAGSSEAQSYRLIWIAFPAGRTVVLRLRITPDGAAKLYLKQTPFGETNPLLNKENSISIAAADGFLECVKKGNFWELPTREYPESRVHDGTYWYIEGARGGHYHMVYRRAPELHPSRFTDIGRYLAKDLAQLGDSTMSIPRSDRSEPIRRNGSH